jgi:hypothetical protein
VFFSHLLIDRAITTQIQCKRNEGTLASNPSSPVRLSADFLVVVIGKTNRAQLHQPWMASFP